METQNKLLLRESDLTPCRVCAGTRLNVRGPKSFPQDPDCSGLSQ